YASRPRSQDMPSKFKENGAVCVTKKDFLIKNNNRLGGDTRAIVMDPVSSIDIDDEDDFYLVEKLIIKIPTNAVNVKVIKMVLFDCDGILTDGSVYLDNEGKEMLRFSRIDGHGIGLLNKEGYKLGIISSENSEIIRKRAEKLNIPEVFLGIKDKLVVYEELKEKYGLKDEEICYCGDDLSDVEILKKVGWSCCPSNSQKEVKEVCNLVSEFKGGNGFVRQISNLLLSGKSEKNKGKGDNIMKTLNINGKEISDESKPFFIAEIGINHNGSMDLTKKMIDLAVITGVNAVKFQKRTVELCVPDSVKNSIRETPWGKMTYFDYKKKIEFGEEEYKEIDRYCREKGILWTASVWDTPSLEFIEKFNVPFHKIPSALLTHKELLLKIKETGKPVILSTGMSTEEEVLKAVSLFGENYPLAILHCNSGYPAKEEELNLNYILKLKQIFPDKVIGYSGHERGISATLVAATLGAKIIERHITLDRSMWGTDQAASIEFDGLRRLVRDLNSLDIWFGNGVKTVTDTEKAVRDKLRNVNTL
ncbi:MAG: HAD-IIIA family hydrolase, partial [Nanoarchaeota archaeon]